MKKKKTASRQPKLTKAAKLYELLSTDGDNQPPAKLAEDFRCGGREKINLLKGIQKLGKKDSLLLESVRFGEFLARFSNNGLTSGSWYEYFSSAIQIFRNLASEAARTDSEAKIITTAIRHCAKPPRGLGVLPSGTLQRLVLEQNVSVPVLAAAIDVAGTEPTAAEAVGPWLNEALCGLMQKEVRYGAEELRALISSLMNVQSKTGSVYKPLVVSVAFLIKFYADRKDGPLLADVKVSSFDDNALEPLALVLATASETALEEESTVSVARLKQELEHHHKENAKLVGQIRKLQSDDAAKVNDFARQKTEWRGALDALETRLMETAEALQRWKEDHRRQANFRVEQEKINRQQMIEDLRKRLIKPANDAAILLKKMLEASTPGNHERDLRRLAVNFSKLHKALNRLTGSDGAHQLPNEVLKQS